MTMVRKQVFITTEQNRLLKLRAKAAKRPEAELIRAAIDRELGIESEKDDWKARIMQCAGALKDTRHLEKTIAENRRRMSRRLDAAARKLGGDD